MSDWDQPLGGERKVKPSNEGKDPFMKLSDGVHTLRVLTVPFQYLNHKFKKEGEAGYGDNARCSMPLHNKCPLCALGDKAKKRWYAAVIDRADGRRKIIDIGAGVFGGIKALKKLPKWGDPLHYDIDITVDSKAQSSQGWYTVTPNPKEPLSDNDLKLKQEVNEEELQAKCTPPTPENVLSRLNFLRQKKNLAAIPMPEMPETAAKTPVVDQKTDDSADESDAGADDEFAFPPVG